LYGNANLEKAIAVRAKITLSILMLVFSIVLLFLGGNVLMNGLVFIVLAILFAYEFTYLNNTGWANLILTLLLVLVFANHYYFKVL
jgi:4-hydroxybenzoate polyprenyltransferase